MSATIIVDAMGGDEACAVPVQSVLELCKEHQDLTVLLVGTEKDILSCIDGDLPENVRIVSSSSEIAMGDSPAKAYREKNDSSIHKGIDLLVEGKGDAFFSAGKTGAVVAVSYFKSGILESISRPALAAISPSVDSKKLIILDLGATIEPKAENYLDFGILGEAYRFCITGLEDSTIGILNVGEEENKGTKTVVDASELLKRSGLNYTGFIEGNRLFVDPNVDVLVTDAFTGNITLKTVEGLNEAISLMIKSKIAPPRWKRTRAFFFNKIFGEVFSQFQYNLYGTALLLGTNHLIGVGHGRSDVSAFKNAILRLKKHAERDFLNKFKERVKHTKKLKS